LEGLPSSVSYLTALQQLELFTATLTELNGLKALTALTKLRVIGLRPDAMPLQLPALHSLDTGILLDIGVLFHAASPLQLSSCPQLRQLTLQDYVLV